MASTITMPLNAQMMAPVLVHAGRRARITDRAVTAAPATANSRTTLESPHAPGRTVTTLSQMAALNHPTKSPVIPADQPPIPSPCVAQARAGSQQACKHQRTT
jgi:hypothetical protein